ncbi:MAG: dienelactone hydrolase family protein [Polyangiales bacterium]
MRRGLVLLCAAVFGCSLTSPAAPVPQRAASPATVAAPTPPAPPPEVGLEFVVAHTAGASPGARLPLLVALHGYGDSPERFIQLFDALPFPARVVALRGPHPMQDGASWFPIGDGAPGPFLASVDRVARALDALPGRFSTCGRPLLTGFSQGAMLTFAVAARSPGSIRAAVPIAGRLPDFARPARAPTAPRLPVVTALHGTDDRRIAFAQGEDATRALTALGFSATLRAFPGVGHAVPFEVRQALYEALGVGAAGACDR